VHAPPKGQNEKVVCFYHLSSRYALAMDHIVSVCRASVRPIIDVLHIDNKLNISTTLCVGTGAHQMNRCNLGWLAACRSPMPYQASLNRSAPST